MAVDFMSEPVNTSKIFKEPVFCFGCKQSFYFTLWAIAESESLVCPQCSADINLTGDAYKLLVVNVKEVISAISRHP
jgi:uncharacterized protein CbrC (UPF0167 family)